MYASVSTLSSNGRSCGPRKCATDGAGKKVEGPVVRNSKLYSQRDNRSSTEAIHRERVVKRISGRDSGTHCQPKVRY